MIMLRIKRVRTRDGRKANEMQPVPPPAGGRFREHCVGYGAVLILSRTLGSYDSSFGSDRRTYPQHSSTWSTEPYDPENPGSFVTFVFRYRSRGKCSHSSISITY